MFISLLLASGFHQLTTSQILANVRAAVQISAKAQWQEASLTGKATHAGVPCSYTMRFRPNGQFVQLMHGALQGGFGFDGKQNWYVDASGMPRVSWYGDAAARQAIASLVSNRWLREGELERSAILNQSSDEATLLFKTWGNELEETVVVDTQSWLPRSAAFETHTGPIKIKLGNWGAVGSEKVPFHAEVDDSGVIESFDVQQATASDSVDPASYRMPDKELADAAYNRAIPAEIESKTVHGHLFVHPLLNGKDVGWFVLDTCAEVMMIDEHVADSLSLEKLGGNPITGVGGTIIEPYRRAREFKLGPATVSNIIFSQLDAAPFSKMFGIQVAGIVGSDVLKRFVVEIDVKTPTVSIYDRHSYQLPRGTWEPLTFSGGNPAVEATFEGRRGWFHLDVGSDSALMVHTPSVKGLHLLDDRKTQGGMTGGFGGMIAIRLGPLEWLSLGGHRFEQVPTVFSLAEHGALANPDVIGTIGQPLMEPFTLVFDFANYRVAFLPSDK